jgi:hypothetical protein
MELSTAASFTAAVISLITLVVTTYFTGRRERVKWAREALAEAFYDFVNISYAASDALHHHQNSYGPAPASRPFRPRPMK